MLYVLFSLTQTTLHSIIFFYSNAPILILHVRALYMIFRCLTRCIVLEVKIYFIPSFQRLSTIYIFRVSDALRPVIMASLCDALFHMPWCCCHRGRALHFNLLGNLCSGTCRISSSVEPRCGATTCILNDQCCIFIIGFVLVCRSYFFSSTNFSNK
jgi:hypothetical protein